MRHRSLVRIEHLSKYYGERLVVDDVSVEVPEGSVAVFLGPNGAGKSTTLEILTTLRLPTSGRVRVDGLDVVADRARVLSLLGWVPQTNALDPLMTVAESIDLQVRATGRHHRTRADEVVDLMALAPHADKRVSVLSGGTRRRVDLALALVSSPRLLVLDEPTTGVDPASRLGLWEEVRRLVAEDGMTVAMSTQDLHEADVLASELHVMRDGALVASGPPAELKRRIGERTLVIRARTPEGAAAIGERLPGGSGRGVGTTVSVPLPEESAWVGVLTELGSLADQVDSLSVHDPTLDEAFAVLTAAPADHGTEVSA